MTAAGTGPSNPRSLGVLVLGALMVPGSLVFSMASWQERWQEASMLNPHLQPGLTLVSLASSLLGAAWCLVALGWVWTYRGHRTTPYITAVLVVLLASLLAAFVARAT